MTAEPAGLSKGTAVAHGPRLGLPVLLGCGGAPSECIVTHWARSSLRIGAPHPGQVVYEDFVVAGTRLAAQLRAKGADIVVALTHMRQPNDVRLAASVPGIDLILGGHDHEYFELEHVQPYGVPYVKSGTDFREYTELILRPVDPQPSDLASRR